MPGHSPRQRTDRVTIACRNCRQRKVRCNGGAPCRDCLRLGKECIYPPATQRRRRKTHNGHGSRAQNSALASSVDVNLDTAMNDDESTLQISQPLFGFDRGFSDLTCVNEHGETVPEDAVWEYHEPWSWTSICSETGSKWVRNTTGNRDFAAAAKRFTRDLVQSSSCDNCSSAESGIAEVDQSVAFGYVDAFFRNCWEASLGIVDRAAFESRLRGHYRTQTHKDDAAFYALRNVIYAAGLQSILSEDPLVSFATAQADAGHYFKMALSVLTKLLLPPSNLTAIRALILMSCYTEGLGNPNLKYFLCSNAVHLAQAKGLHRQPDRAWGRCPKEALGRSNLWWSLYALEKHLSLSSCRPSAIDDEIINISMPDAYANIHTHPQGFRFRVRLAKIQSGISRQLLSLKALSMTVHELIQTVARIHEELSLLLSELPKDLEIGSLGRSSHSPKQVNEILYLHFSIHSSIMAAHCHFFYPWLASRFTGVGSDAIVKDQIASSSSIIAEAARKIILALRLVNPSAATPSCLAFYYPLHAMINLFIHLVKYPALSTTATDLGLLDACVGHFGYVEFFTASAVSIALPREVANVASWVVQAARPENRDSTAVERATDNTQQNESEAQHAGTEVFNFNLDDFQTDPTLHDEFTDFLQFDTTGWNLLSSFDMLCSNAPSHEN